MLYCYVWFIYLWIKKLKVCNLKKNYFKYTKSIKKTKIIQTESKIDSTA